MRSGREACGSSSGHAPQEATPPGSPKVIHRGRESQDIDSLGFAFTGAVHARAPMRRAGRQMPLTNENLPPVRTWGRPEQAALPAHSVALLADDACSHSHGISVESAAPGQSRLSMTVRAEMLNSHGICHGGIIFLLADTALAYAANDGAAPVVSTGAQVHYLNPARMDDVLSADCEALHEGAKSGLYDVTVTNQEGAVVATFRGQSLRARSLAAPAR
ncbi:hydroxyphenylacetyl-CoA thioesterase PaaI [Streptomyces sp. NPDC056002]|uniref:hydroxyphenylacetyl-CoA thioesterase PaaI n=1 Tax=Streptomyces sp. NPDC056002 TaxID=3345675 RepID=UPI0035D6DA3A